ncbi:MAG: hypothetical protein J6X51_07235, partial [Bacteroidales bacterium]|nr:hypothetical protein [Bacteroidales bacterium]
MQDFFSDVAIFTLSKALFSMDFYMHLIDFLILVYVKITISKKCVSGAFLNDYMPKLLSSSFLSHEGGVAWRNLGMNWSKKKKIIFLCPVSYKFYTFAPEFPIQKNTKLKLINSMDLQKLIKQTEEKNPGQPLYNQ